VALVVVVCAIVLVHHIREARRLHYPLKDYPALAPEMLLAAVKAAAYG
jgi:transposase